MNFIDDSRFQSRKAEIVRRAVHFGKRKRKSVRITIFGNFIQSNSSRIRHTHHTPCLIESLTHSVITGTTKNFHFSIVFHKNDVTMPSTDNQIEGGANSQLRALLRNHRGLSLMRRVKAVYWWCYLHTECPMAAAETLSAMSTDDDIDFPYRTYSASPKRGGDGDPEWGDSVVWEELHHKDPFPFWLD